MINKICESLLKKIRKEMPYIDDERAEIILYGLQLIVGEVPKIILLFAVAILLKIGWLVIFAYATMLPYKIVAGGFHLKTNLGCMIGTFVVYFGNVLISKYIVLFTETKYLLTLFTLIFSIIMICLYAPADTINLPILRQKERKTKKVLSYIFAIITLIASLLVQNNTLSNILLFNVLIETICISKLAYRITKNEYGYKTYLKQEVI
jgi:accessory gene regulator B